MPEYRIDGCIHLYGIPSSVLSAFIWSVNPNLPACVCDESYLLRIFFQQRLSNWLVSRPSCNKMLKGSVLRIATRLFLLFSFRGSKETRCKSERISLLSSLSTDNLFLRAAFGGEIQIPATTSSARPSTITSPVPCQASRVLHAGAKKNPCKGNPMQYTTNIINWRISLKL